MSEPEPITSSPESPSAPSPASTGGPRRAGTPARVAALILAFILAFVAVVAVVTMLELRDLTPCEDVTSVTQLVDGECFDGSASAKARSQVFGWLGAGFAVLSIVAALGLTLTGRLQRTFAFLTAATLISLALSLLL